MGALLSIVVPLGGWRLQSFHQTSGRFDKAIEPPACAIPSIESLLNRNMSRGKFVLSSLHYFVS